MPTTTTTTPRNIDVLTEEAQYVLAAITLNGMSASGGDFGYLDEVQVHGIDKATFAGYVATLVEQGFIDHDVYEFNQGDEVDQVWAVDTTDTAVTFADWADWADETVRRLDGIFTADEAEAGVPEPGTPAAAQVELDRRAHNRTVKRTGEGERIEAASDWAFAASTADLKALVA